MKIEQAKQDHRTLALWAADCAERVLPYFEQKYPQDDRPRKSIEAGRAWVRGEIKISQARTAALAAHDAARQAADSAAIAAARSAGHAAATPHVPDHARHAANYAVKAVTAGSTDTAAIATELDWQYRRIPGHLPGHLRSVAFRA